MKNLIKSVFTAIMYIIAVLVLGALVPFIVATVTYLTFPIYIPFRECIANAGFVIFTIVGIIVSCIYLGAEHDRLNK